MKRKSHILSATALGLLLGTVPIGAIAAEQSCDPQTQNCQLQKNKHNTRGHKPMQPNGTGQAPATNGSANQAQKTEQPKTPKRPKTEHLQARPEQSRPQPKQAQGHKPMQPNGTGQAPTTNGSANQAQKAEQPKTPKRPKTEHLQTRPEQSRPQPKQAQGHKPMQPNGTGQAPTTNGSANQAQKAEQPKTPKTEHLQARPEQSRPQPKQAQGHKPKRRAAPEQPAQEQPIRREQIQPSPAGSQEVRQGQKSAPETQKPSKAQNKLPAGQRPQLPTGLSTRARKQEPANAEQTSAPQSLRQIRTGAPESDAAAQVDIRVGTMLPITELSGQRSQKPPRILVQPEVPQGGEVVSHTRDRTVIRIGNRIIMRDMREPWLTRRSSDVYYEELPHDQVRITVVRADGSRVITIRNRYGDIVRRSRVLPDGREIVLIYLPDEYRHGRGTWYQPPELPPRPQIPTSDYVATVQRAYSPDYYYNFLVLPPIEPIRRIYTLDQVRYTPRLREILPRLDLEIHFATGSAEIAPSQYGMLENLAYGIRRVLAENPAETFLIEGFTDAVGTPQSNLVLSDERANSVAEALVERYDIPPENLVTQGYGESELKVQTQGPSAQNRRVAIQRITPLVTPIARR